MDQIRVDGIEARLRRLERENRRLKRIGIISAVGAVLFLIGGARDSDEGGLIKGKQLLLTDDAKGASIALGTAKDGEPAMAFRRTVEGKKYSMEMKMFVAGDGVPVLIFEDQEGIRRYKIPR